MGTKVGIGFSNSSDSKTAGQEAAKAAMTKLGADGADLVMLFSTRRHNAAQLRDGVRSIIPAPGSFVGGHTVGVITNDKVAYDGFEVGVLALSSDTVSVKAFCEPGLERGEAEVGSRLAKQLPQGGKEGSNLMLMYDITKVAREEGQPAFFQGNELIQGMTQGLKQWPTTAGFAMNGDYEYMKPCVQYFGDKILNKCAMGVSLTGDVRMDTVVVHGCKPAGGTHRVTKSDGQAILEIDGKPVMQALTEILGADLVNQIVEFPPFLILGVKRAEHAVTGEDYALTVGLELNPTAGYLVTFRSLPAGTEIRIMRRTTDLSMVEEAANGLLKKLGHRKPIFATYFNCAGRVKKFAGTVEEDVIGIQKAIGSKIPLFGVYGSGEIGPFGAKPEAVVLTGVLSVFSEP